MNNYYEKQISKKDHKQKMNLSFWISIPGTVFNLITFSHSASPINFSIFAVLQKYLLMREGK